MKPHSGTQRPAQPIRTYNGLDTLDPGLQHVQFTTNSDVGQVRDAQNQADDAFIPDIHDNQPVGAIQQILDTLHIISSRLNLPSARNAAEIAIANRQNDINMAAVSTRIEKLMVIFTPLMHLSQKELSGIEMSTINRLAAELSDVAITLQELARTRGARFDVQQSIDTCTRQLEWAIQRFQVDLSLRSQIRDSRDHQELRPTLDQLEERAHMAHVIRLREILQPTSAWFDPQAGPQVALKGTCAVPVKKILKWIKSDDPKEPRLFYLYGLLGTGKSTITNTISQYCTTHDIVSASFFFAWNSVERRDAVYVFRSIAYQLAHAIPSFQRRILQVDPEICRLNLRIQITKLIVEPLRSATNVPSPLVVILDAIDECEERSDATDIISLIADAVLELPARLRPRFLITSRPETHIQSRVTRLLTTDNAPHILDLYSVVNPTDIHLYLQARLRGVLVEHDIDRVADVAGSLFIVAHVAADFILKHPHGDLKSRFESLISSDTSKGFSPYYDLDKQYLRVLSRALPATLDEYRYLERRLRQVLGAIAVAFDNLSPVSLELLLELESGTVNMTLTLLHSLVAVPADPSPLRLIHNSFSGFLTQPDRCTDSRFIIDPAREHSRMALQCLRHMTNLLRRDICNLEAVPRLNSEIDDLPDRMADAVPIYLRYATRNWASHLHRAGSEEQTELIEAVEAFCQAQLLPWLEVLSLSQNLDGAMLSLRLAEGWLKRSLHSSERVLAVVKDTQYFVARFYDAISVSAGNIYRWALPCTPDCSLYKVYKAELVGCVAVRRGRGVGWGTDQRMIEASRDVDRTDPPLDGVASAESTIWPAHTDTSPPAAQKQGYTETKGGSANGVGQPSNTTTSWGSIKGEDHTGNVTCGTFSADEGYIATGAVDRSIRLWHAGTGAHVVTLPEHSAQVLSVAFTPNGRCLISVSIDDAIRLWMSRSHDVRPDTPDSFTSAMSTLEEDQEVLEPKSSEKTNAVWEPREVTMADGWVTSVAFSSDSHRVAFGSSDQTIRVWDAESGTPVAMLKGHTAQVWSITFSPNNELIASGSWDCTVQLWEAETGDRIISLEGHTEKVHSVAFSPDGTSIVSGAADKTVRHWTVVTGSLTQVRTLNGHTDQVLSVAFSPDGVHIVSGSADKTVRIWSAKTSDHITTLEGHTNWLRSVSYSPDGQYITSKSEDGSVLHWDTSTIDDPPETSYNMLDRPAPLLLRWKTPWVMYGDCRLCHLTAEFTVLALRGLKMVVSAANGQFFLLDFASVVAKKLSGNAHDSSVA